MSNIIRKIKCIHCKNEFNSSTISAKFCSNKCKGIYGAYKESEKLKLNSIENTDYVICKYCGMAVKRIYSGHFKRFHPDKNNSDYRKDFGVDALLCIPSDKAATTINGGKHMKEDKWRKWISDRMKGEGNIMSKSKTTEQKRKETSPFSIEFYKKRYPNLTDEEYFIMKKDNYKYFMKNRVMPIHKEYWIRRGFSLEEAKNIISKIQCRDLNFFINKYGEEIGIEKWNLKINRWSNNFKVSSYSKVSQKLFISLYEIIKDKYNEIYFATLNKNKIILDDGTNSEYRLRLCNRIILPDFFIKDINKIIEFDGVYYHKNNPENNKREKDRDDAILRSGYEVYHVNELEYYKDPDLVINNCLEFIENKNK